MDTSANEQIEQMTFIVVREQDLFEFWYNIDSYKQSFNCPLQPKTAVPPGWRFATPMCFPWEYPDEYCCDYTTKDRWSNVSEVTAQLWEMELLPEVGFVRHCRFSSSYCASVWWLVCSCVQYLFYSHIDYPGWDPPICQLRFLLQVW